MNCSCGLSLHHTSIKLGLTQCHRCRQREKYRASWPEVKYGRYVGKVAGAYIAERITQNFTNTGDFR